jgi:hypothetical protein
VGVLVVSIVVSKRLSRIREILKLIEDLNREIEALCERIASFGERLHGRIEEAIRNYCRVIESRGGKRSSVKLYECVKDGVKFYAVTYSGEEEWLRTLTEDKEEAERELRELLKKIE